MSHLFLHIFQLFQHRKMWLWTLLTIIIGLLTFSASRISFVEDISSFLPNNSDNKRINEAYQKMGAASKIVVTISHKDSQVVDEALLMDAATRFAEILLQNDTLGHVKELMYEVDPHKIREVTDFITQNLPFFLEEEDYLRIDSLLNPQAIENLLKANKELLLSPMGGFVRNVILNDPLHFSQNALKNLEVFKQGDNYNTDNGFIFNDKGECIVLIDANYPISETANNKLLALEISNAINKTVSAFDNQINIVPFGAALISITNAEQIKNDAFFAVSIALVLILTLLFYFYRNVKSLFFIALSTIFGALFSLGMIVLFKSTVSIIAIGISSIIFGIAINYPLHFLACLQHTPNIKQTIKIIVNPLLIGNITTVGAFLSLLFISSDAMKDLGLYSSFLLIGTIAFVLIFLPHLLGRVKVIDEVSAVKELTFGRLAEFLPEKNRYIVLVFLVFTVVLFFFSFGVTFDFNLHAINYMTAEQRVEMNKLMEQNRGKGKTHYVVAEGANTQEALQNYEKFVLPQIHGLSNSSGISNLFPSKALQEQKIIRWNQFWNDRKDTFIEKFNEICKKQGFNDNVFEHFITTIHKNFQPQEFSYFTPIYQNTGENYFSISSNKTMIYTTIQDTSDAFHFPTPSNSSVFIFDDSSMAEKMVNALSDDFNKVLYICGFIVFAFLFFTFGRIELAVLTFIPLTVAWVWILGIMNIFGLSFNIVNIILATFIFGQGDDYTILITEGLIHEYTYGKKMLAKFKNSIILSATILFIAIGMLIFAKHPALRSLANVTIVGMVSVVLCAFIFPPLIFRYITTKRGKPRIVPWTLKRFLSMAYSFFIFLSGSLLLTISGFVLFGFRKTWNAKNRLRYHRLLQWAANFAIRGIPGVKFHFNNVSGETFDKPAVIISNHQSHLDLMCLMMLTPKLIILTNDWVWNSPFYGRLIRYADYYPVSKGIENSIGQLKEAISRGYSIVIFPEGTRSEDCTIKRFHQGAFYLAHTLNLDMIPVFLHGVGDVLPKNDFFVRQGAITLQVHERITPTDHRFAADYFTRTKQICQYYRQTFTIISQTIETPDYFKNFVLHQYMYKGIDVWRGVKKEINNVGARFIAPPQINNNTTIIQNNGYGIFSLLYALTHKKTQVIAIEADEEKVTIAKNCAGLPKNLTIYHTSEWTNM